jgi:site-specific DNA-methyltransferase (adenine-specific)
MAMRPLLSTNGSVAASPRCRRAAREGTPRQAANTASRPAHHPSFSLPDPDTRVYVGDARELLASIPECRDAAVDLIYADPPFNWRRDYDRHEVRPHDDAVWNDAIPDDDYLEFTYDWLDLCIKALTPTGSLWVNIPDDWAAEVVVHLKQRGLQLVNWCIWHYRFGQNRLEKFINSKVHVLYFCKHPFKRTWNVKPILEPTDRATIYADKRTYNKKEGDSGLRVPMDVWYGRNWGRIQGNNKERRPGHDNQIPEVYLERVLRACSREGDLVLDPFLGSGTTSTVARELRRRSIGIEYSRANAASAFDRIKRGPLRVRYDTPTVHINPIFPKRILTQPADA